MTVITSPLPLARCLAALQYVAGLFETKLSGGPVMYTAQISPTASSLRLLTDLGDQLPQIDETITLRIVIADGTKTSVQVESVTPLHYMTGALGFDSDAVNSFTTTLNAELLFEAGEGRRPSFPAPPRPPQL